MEHQTQNPQLVAWLGLAITVPQLFSFITGAVSDVYNRIMMTTDFLSMLIVLIMTLYFKTFGFSYLFILFSFFILNLCDKIFIPCSRAFLPDMTSTKFLNLGNSLFTMATQLSTIIGATIGAVLLNKLNIVVFFLFNAATFLFSFLMAALIRNDHGHPAHAGAKGRLPEKLFEAFNKKHVMIFVSNVKGVFPCLRNINSLGT